MSGTYFLGGVILLLTAIILVTVLPNMFLSSAITVIQGSFVLGLAFFGVIFIVVAIESIKSESETKSEPDRETEELKKPRKK